MGAAASIASTIAWALLRPQPPQLVVELRDRPRRAFRTFSASPCLKTLFNDACLARAVRAWARGPMAIVVGSCLLSRGIIGLERGDFKRMAPHSLDRPCRSKARRGGREIGNLARESCRADRMAVLQGLPSLGCVEERDRHSSRSLSTMCGRPWRPCLLLRREPTLRLQVRGGSTRCND